MRKSDLIKEMSVDAGFDFAGVTAAEPVGEPHAGALGAWLGEGCHAGMEWMARAPERRLDPRTLAPAGRSVLMVGLSWFTEPPPEAYWNDPERGRVAAYAWGPDYHDVMGVRLNKLIARIRREFGNVVVPVPFTDTRPVLERAVAERAGLGFAGRNTCLIRPGWGSCFFLGGLVLPMELEPDGAPQAAALQDDPIPTLDARPSPPALPPTPCPPSLAPRPLPHAPHPTSNITRRTGCGACTRCLAACPTGALTAAYRLDARRCLSYLTIEHRGDIPEDLRPRMGRWVFGCDECQAVCPWVRKFSRPARDRFLRFDPDLSTPRFADLLALDETSFRDRYRRTPLWRAKRQGLVRNAVVALANSGAPGAKDLLERAARDPDPVVQSHASWALAGRSHKTPSPAG